MLAIIDKCEIPLKENQVFGGIKIKKYFFLPIIIFLYLLLIFFLYLSSIFPYGTVIKQVYFLW